MIWNIRITCNNESVVLVGNLLSFVVLNKARLENISFFFSSHVFKMLFIFFLLSPNIRITILQQSHNNSVAVMLHHSEYAYAFIFLLLFFLIYNHLHEGAHLSLKSLHCCLFLLYSCFKGSQSPRRSSIHPPNTNELSF